MKKIIFTLGVALAATLLPMDSSAQKSKTDSTRKKTQTETVDTNKKNNGKDTPTVNDKKTTTKPEGQTTKEVKDSLTEIVNKANAGDAEAMNDVGTWYYKGIHYDRDYKKAAEWFGKSAKGGNPRATANLARCFQKGNGVEADSVMAMSLYDTAVAKGNKQLVPTMDKEAKKGDVFANVFLGRHYAAAKDVYKSSEYYTVAAEKGSADACRELGLELLNNKQPADALKYFKKGYKMGDIVSTYWYGWILYEGKGVQRDQTEGIIAIQKSAEAGFANGQLTLGQAYYSGAGVHRDAEQGFKWIEKAAQNGNKKAEYQVAMKLVEGDGTPIDYDRATKWFTIAVGDHLGGTFAIACKPEGALYGSPYLTYLKAIAAYQGGDFDAALKGAKELQKSKIAGVKAAGQTLEARVYRNKKYAKTDVKKAVKLLTKAVEADNATACFILAELNYTSTDIKRDEAKADELMMKAVKLNNPEACCYMGNICYEGRGVQKDLAAAVKLYERAGQLKTESAAKHLADCYANGLGGLKKDEKKAEQELTNYYHPNLSSLVALLPAEK